MDRVCETSAMANRMDWITLGSVRCGICSVSSKYGALDADGDSGGGCSISISEE